MVSSMVEAELIRLVALRYPNAVCLILSSLFSLTKDKTKGCFN
jgi:hypothetical protein